VVESDESDGSFLKLAPIFAIVTNIDREHLDHYATIEEIREAFTQFVNKVPFYGAAFVCLDDENVQQILPQVKRRTITYGRSAQADFEITKMDAGQYVSRFELRHGKDELGAFELHVPGEHNVLNATAAIAAALELDIKRDVIREGLAQYRGVDRRFQVKGVEQGVTVVDDYGHHPTEIRATLAAARSCAPRRLLVLFQPHRYTRTMHLMDEFARSFHQADRVLVLDIYPASEQPIEGVTSEVLVDRMRQYAHRGAEYVGSIANGVQQIAASLEPGDMVITLGAGSVSSASELILESLKNMPARGVS